MRTVFRLGVVAVAVVSTSAAFASAPLSRADREKKEARFVELLKTGLDQKAPADKQAARGQLREMTGLLAELAGVDLDKRTPEDGTKLAATQAEILKRRDPALAERLEKELTTYACRSRQTEAIANLRAYANAQAAYKDERGAYAGDLKALDAYVETQRYDLSIAKATKEQFVLRATGRDEMKGDAWEIDQGGTPKNVTNACAPK